MSLVRTRSLALWPPISDLLRSILRWICPGVWSADEPTGRTDQRTSGRLATRTSRVMRNRMRASMLGNRCCDECMVSCTGAGHSRALNVDKATRAPAKISHEMPRPTSFGKDTGLQARMAMTMFLLGAVYVVLVVVAIAAIGKAAPVLVIALVFAALNLFASDKLALAAMGAREVSPQEAPQLHAMIERLCVQADLPKPKVAVANTAMPNAFALGRSPKSATVCATTGIMDL